MSESMVARRGRWTLLATGLGLFMIFLDAAIVNVAIPDIQREFGGGESALQWVVAGYSLTFAMFIMSAGKVGDQRGRRLAYISGIIVFCLASLACGLAPNLPALSVARAVQGVGAALVNVASLALVSAAYPDPNEKARAIGIWTAIAAVGLTLGPVLGGVLTEALGWRSIFLINPLIGLVPLVLTILFVAESRDPTDRGFDVPGQAIFLLGIGGLTFALIQGGHLGWTSPATVAILVASFALLGAFAWFELRTPQPMMDVRVFGNHVYSVALYAVFAVLFCVYGTLFLITQYFQNVRAYSPERTGIMILAMSVPTVILAPLSGRLVATKGGRRPTLWGMSFAVVAMGILAASNGSHLPVTLAGLLAIGIAGGLSVAAATSVAMGSIPPERAGMASGILSTQRGLGSTAGFAIMGSVLVGVVSTVLPGRLEPSVSERGERARIVDQVVDGANPQAVTSIIGPSDPIRANVTEQRDVLQEADDAFIAGIRAAMLVGLVVSLSALVLVWVTFPRGGAAARDDPAVAR
ncbi:MAG: MFS transporter [Actinomycetota bacterium]|nr:MFS transporter [Actinomycetota bacterium]MDH5313592.1 MFS transporter [Actinomycetota bacterium]